jgi:hypothetical protein
MDELIKSVQKTPIVPDALKKHEEGPRKKPDEKKKDKSKKDPKHIIDTYA